jgi:hypothetical protein
MQGKDAGCGLMKRYLSTIGACLDKNTKAGKEKATYSRQIVLSQARVATVTL